MKNIFDTRRVRPNEIIVHNTYESAIPANSFVMILSYDKTNQHFIVDRPDADFFAESELAFVPEDIAEDDLGVGIIDGVGVVKETSGETISAGDTVGTDTDEFTAILGAGGFKVLYDDSGTLVMRRQGTASSAAIHKAFCKVDAGSGSTIVCYLDVDATGDEITVGFPIAQGGTTVNTAVPRLKDGDMLFVYKFGTDWYCIGLPMMPSEDCDCYSAP